MTTDLRPAGEHVVVTGCAGFIGSHVVDSLLAGGAQVTGIDHLTDSYAPALKLANLEPARRHGAFRFLDLDLASAPLAAVVDRADAVVHLAAEPGVRPSWGERFSVYVRNNLVATQRLLHAACTWGMPRFVYASSSSIYGEAECLPTPEDVPPQPVSPYGVTKLGGEHLCASYRAGHGLPVVTLRLFSVFGPRQRPDMAFARFCAAALAGDEIDVYGDGRQTRDFTYVGDVVRAVRAAIDAPGAVGATYNIGGGTRSSVADAIAQIGALTGTPLTVRHQAVVAGDVRDTAADTRRAARDLGFTARTSLAEGLAEQVAWAMDRAGAERAA
jgi:nucleoside-diphosphate-sugar epimerase